MPVSPSIPEAHAVTRLVARRLSFDEIPRAAWDRLLAGTASRSPFSRWTFHRAWWDGYGSTAIDQYLVIIDEAATDTADARAIRGIVPLMRRHEIEPYDLTTRTVVREHSPTCANVTADASAVFFGASYHADYATVLASEDDLAAVAAAAVHTLEQSAETRDGLQPWDVIDLRRLREADPALPALQAALEDTGRPIGWTIDREQEDVCPVVTVTADGWDEYLATLDKTARHEIRRKLRRASAIGHLTIELSPPTPTAIADFIRLHTLRFGNSGLFPDNEGGARSRRFIERLGELELAEGDAGQLEVALVRCGARLIFAALVFDDGETCFLYNAGVDPNSAQASPGVTGTAEYFRNRIEAGRRRFDFLRGDERYKYEWGAVDEPIYRLLAQRSVT